MNAVHLPSNKPANVQPLNSRLMMDAWDPCSPRHDVAHMIWKKSLTPDICCYNKDRENDDNINKTELFEAGSRTDTLFIGSSMESSTIDEEEEPEQVQRRSLRSNKNKKGDASDRKRSMRGLTRKLSRLGRFLT